MDAFGVDHYVPILFTKAGERDAIAGLDESLKDAFTPLFVVHPIDWDFELGQPKKTADEHLSKLPAELQKIWDRRPAFIDVLPLDDDTMADGTHPLEWIVTAAQQLNLPLVPVVSPSRSADSLVAAHNLITAGICTDVCLRLEAEHWPVPPQSEEIDALLAEIGIDKSNTHIILDLEDDTGQSSRFALSSALDSLAGVNDWKTLTVTATAMPQTPPPTKGLHEVARQEWLNYEQLVTQKRYGSRQPTFGDYAIAHPDPLADAIDPRFMQISAKFKYTCDYKWLVGKGDLFKGTGGRSVGGAAIRPVARAISVHNEFTGGHCTTEGWILAAAADGQPGSPKTWVEVATRHHIGRVIEQLRRG